jgi:hypothetical protein
MISGKYAYVSPEDGEFNETYLTHVSTKPSTVHCLDFFYYITNELDEAKITVGWKMDETMTTIIEVTALPENKWQQSRINYMSPSSEMNQVK